MKAIIIDISAKYSTKILNTRITASSVQVISGFFMPVRYEEDPLESAAAKLKQEDLSDIPLYVIPPLDMVHSQIFQLPPMPDKEIEKILPREIAGSTDSTDPIVFDYLNNGLVIEKQVEKLEIVAFFAGRQPVIELLNKIKSLGLQAAKIIPEAQGLRSILEHNPGLTSEKTGLVFLDIMEGRINMNIYKHLKWGLHREFAFQLAPNDALEDDDFSRISIELNRTFQYFKQKNRIFSVDKAIIYGVNPNLKHLKDFIVDNHPVAAEIIRPDHFAVKMAYPPQLKTLDEFVSIFALSLGTAVALTNRKVLNVFPPEYKERERLPRRLLGLAVSAIVIAAMLLAATFYFEKVKSSYREDITQIDKTFSSLSKNAQEIERAKHKRADFYKKRFFTDIPFIYSYGSADFIRRISFIVPHEVQLTRLDIKPLTQGFTFELKGNIDARNNIDAQATFLRLYQRLKEFDNMSQITFSTIKVNPGDEKTPGKHTRGTEGSPDTSKQVELFFTINGEIELE